MANVNNELIGDELDQAVVQDGSSNSVRRPLRATMSLNNFEDQEGSGVRPGTAQGSGMRGLGLTVATPEEFVTKFGGKRVINKILIANNGIAGEYEIYAFRIVRCVGG